MSEGTDTNKTHNIQSCRETSKKTQKGNSMKHNLIPMNLQFFADEGGAESNSDSNTEPNNDQGKDKPPVEQPKNDPPKTDFTPQELNDKLQDAMVELAKVKRAQEKAASEAAEYKKKWKESLTIQEQANLEKAEEQAKRDEEFEAMKRKLAINDLVSEYMDRQFPKDIAQKIAEARYEGDNATVNAIEKQMDEAKKKAWESEFLASRPDINIGGGSNANTYTKEQFEGMTLIERSKLRRENEAEYNRLLAL